MNSQAMIFFILALIAGALGFFVLAGTAATIAQVLCLVFMALLLFGMMRGRSHG